MKSILVAMALVSGSAFACQVSDIQAYFRQITPAGINGYCRDHGGSVIAIFAGSGVGVLASDPSTSVGNYVITCVDDKILVGTINLDTASCLGKTAMTEPTIEIWP